MDVVSSAAQPPGEFGRQSEGLSLATQSPLNYVPALPTEPPLDTCCQWSLTTPIFLGKLKPSLCCFCAGLGGGVPPEGAQDEQGEQQCGKGQGVAHGVHNLQPFQSQPLVLGVEVGEENTEIELSSCKPQQLSPDRKACTPQLRLDPTHHN